MRRIRRIYWTNKQISELTGIDESTLRRWDHLYKLSLKDDLNKSKYDRKTVAKIIKFNRLFSRENIVKLKRLWIKDKIQIIEKT